MGTFGPVTLPDGTVVTLTQVNLHSFVHKVVTPTYGVTVAVDASLGDHFLISATDGVAFTISSPVNPIAAGQEITVRVKNISGGTMGNITWGLGYKMATLTKPANGYSKSITFQYDGSAWIEISRTPSDVPNV